MDVYIRKARMQDVKSIHLLLMECAGQGQLLPRSLSSLYGHLRDFYVLVDRGDETVFGCCALTIFWEDHAEIRSLALHEKMKGTGWGRRLVETCLSEAVTLGVYKVFTLTYVSGFFARLGFQEVEKDVLPQKVWTDCINCPKFPDCDETAMLITM
ncbi:N-acetyltransferase [Desulfobaculum sp. SPO524]|uniref:N-acetyltransferase n=1 Tax=Desulfobaculum sp. SPO524 TaxID=3378071 RepID=UPI003852CD45